MGYLGSVKFFRHLILTILLVAASVLCYFSVRVYFYKGDDRAPAKEAPIQKRTDAVDTPSDTQKPAASKATYFPYKNKYAKLYAVPDEEKELDNNDVYLTFDDGPSKHTGAFLDILKKHNIHATFFVVGTNVEKYPDIIRRMHKEGHTIAVHTYSHRYKEIYSSVDAYLSDFAKVNNAIYSLTGKQSGLFRFPGGSINVFNYRIYEELTAEMLRRGFRFFDWNVSAGDAAKRVLRANIVSNVADNVSRRHPNVVLMHDTSELSLSALDAIVVSLKAKNYVFKPLKSSCRPLTFTK
ncbi:MAG: polysaccharide deacetylase family protein [Cloacibacillus sp.]